MTITLNTMIADRYTCETVPGARVGEIVQRACDETIIYHVRFTLPDMAGNFVMNVWQEPDGSIYGEW